MASGRRSSTAKSTYVFGDYLLMLTAPCVLSVWFYGSKAAGTIAVCLLSAVITDFAASIIINKQYFAADLSALCTGIMIAMMNLMITSINDLVNCHQ